MPKTPKPNKKPTEQIVTEKAWGIYRPGEKLPAEVYERSYRKKSIVKYADKYDFPAVREITISYKTKETP